MHIIRVRNVCQALSAGLHEIFSHSLREGSRAGTVLVSPGPVTTVTTRPQERVLFSKVRDANPFFHLYEAIWMLTGRSDAAPLCEFVARFKDFAEPGGEVHGAYGARWRHAIGFDQLDHVVEMLRKDPTSRQAVIQMWDARPSARTGYMNDAIEDTGCDDLRGQWKDRPCNTTVYLRIRGHGGDTWPDGVVISKPERVLDLTVCCRSNDLIWGAHGANAVHFSVLQEYLAARIGCAIGVMYQVSNNYHAYDAVIDGLCGKFFHTSHERPYREMLAEVIHDDRYSTDTKVRPTPMFNVPDEIDNDLVRFAEWHSSPEKSGTGPNYANEWFTDTLEPAMLAHAYYKAGDIESAFVPAAAIGATDWRAACFEWLQRREKRT